MSSSKEQCDYSVAIPAYGRYEQVREAVEAALSQQFPSDMRWEVFVNDDCSPTPLEQVLAEFRGKVRIERNDRNLGFSGNWNNTLSMARGKWVHMLHSDDIVAPQFAAVMWELIRKAPPTTALIHSRLRKKVANRAIVGRLYSRILGHREPQDDPNAPYESYKKGPDAIRHAIQMGVRNTTAVLHRDMACAIDGFREEYGSFSDEEYYVRLAKVGDVVFTPRRLVTYRYHVDQISHRDWMRPEFIDEYWEMHRSTLAVLGEHVTDRDRAMVDRRIARAASGVAFQQAVYGDAAIAQATLRKARERYGALDEMPGYSKAQLFARNKVARSIYRHLFL